MRFTSAIFSLPVSWLVHEVKFRSENYVVLFVNRLPELRENIWFKLKHVIPVFFSRPMEKSALEKTRPFTEYGLLPSLNLALSKLYSYVTYCFPARLRSVPTFPRIVTSGKFKAKR